MPGTTSISLLATKLELKVVNPVMRPNVPPPETVAVPTFRPLPEATAQVVPLTVAQPPRMVCCPSWKLEFWLELTTPLLLAPPLTNTCSALIWSMVTADVLWGKFRFSVLPFTCTMADTAVRLSSTPAMFAPPAPATAEIVPAPKLLPFSNVMAGNS